MTLNCQKKKKQLQFSQSAIWSGWHSAIWSGTLSLTAARHKDAIMTFTTSVGETNFAPKNNVNEF